jgi:hypothetical protein
MNKFKTFFKKVGSVLYDLFIASNRWMHALVGGVIYVVMMAAIVIWTPYEPIPLQCCFGATIATFIAMCASEYKDKAKGGKFDWKDIFAGVIVPIVLDVIVIALMLFGK